MKRNRVYERAFDWDEALRLRVDGWSYNRIADHFGVTETAIRRILVPGLQERMNARVREYQREHKPQQGTCPDCGGINSQGRYRPESRCRECHVKHLATSVREDTLQCGGCRYWLPDEDFPHAHNRKARRGRHALCRPCQNVAKALNRAANRERERVYDRERKRRAKAAS
jgi:hypothetical protein